MTELKHLEHNIEDIEKLGLDTGPILVFKLVKYREEADFSDLPDEKPCTGREAYARYYEATRAILGEYKMKVIFRSFIKQVLVGTANEEWDVLSIAEWETVRQLKEYQQRPEVTRLRTLHDAGLSDYKIFISIRQ